MFTRESDVELTAPSAFAVVQDVAVRNKANAGRFNDAVKQRAGALYDQVVMAFERSRVFSPNYRQRFIAIKVASATQADLVTPRVQQLINRATADGVEVVRQGKNIIFRIKA